MILPGEILEHMSGSYPYQGMQDVRCCPSGSCLDITTVLAKVYWKISGECDSPEMTVNCYLTF